MIEVDKMITDDDFKQLKKDLAARKKDLAALKSVPKFRLKFFGEKALLSTESKKRQPLMLDDIQNLLMSALLGSCSPFKPDRWSVLEKANKVTQTVILVIEGLTSYHFTAYERRFFKTKGIFEEQLEVLLPKYQKNRIIEELCYVPLTQSHKEKLIQQYGSLEAAMHMNKDHHLIAKSVFPIDGDISAEDSQELHEGETFPRTRLLLSPLQMMIEGYPMPLTGEFAERYRDFRYSCTTYKPVTSKSPMFGLDCEMCRTAKAENELTRVSIVDENYQSVYETLVRPSNPITNYLTEWSGITAEMMKDVTKTLKQVQEDVQNLLPPDAILVGQSLNCDLSAMRLMHPYVIDTSVIFNIHGDRNKKAKLQVLAKTFLNLEIQMKKTGHSSIEDSIASLKLTKLKLSQDIYYGDAALQEKRKIVDDQTYTGIANPSGDSGVGPEQVVATTMLSQAMKRCKKSAIVSTNKGDLDVGKFCLRKDMNGDEMPQGITHHKEPTAKKVISKTREVVTENDFSLSHINIHEDASDDDEKLSEDEKIEQAIDKVDKWIEKVYSSVAKNGLFVVILGAGHEENKTKGASLGVSMIKIKN